MAEEVEELGLFPLPISDDDHENMITRTIINGRIPRTEPGEIGWYVEMNTSIIAMIDPSNLGAIQP